MLAVAVCSLSLSGCGGNAGASNPPTPRPTHVPPTATPFPDIPTSTPAPPPATDTPAPTATTSPTPSPTANPTATRTLSGVAPKVVSAGVTPTAAHPGATVTFNVTTLGDAQRVQLNLTAGPGSQSGPFTYSLTQTSDGQWSATVSAPIGGGTYYFNVAIFDSKGHRTIAESSAWMLTVNAPTPTPSAGASPLPTNMPLAPGFSYGNPEAAVFTGEGHVIQGSEVTSTTDTSASGGQLGQYFVTRLQRAGWTVDESTAPAAGAATWSIAATSGNIVTVVQFAAGTLHIFYGTP
jgi:hypothetical protein